MSKNSTLTNRDKFAIVKRILSLNRRGVFLAAAENAGISAQTAMEDYDVFLPCDDRKENCSLPVYVHTFITLTMIKESARRVALRSGSNSGGESSHDRQEARA
jgi:hypothetical protein